MDISPQFVSRVTDQVQEQITDWQNRLLERVYPIIFVDGLRVAVRSDKGVLNKCVYTVLGVNLAGRQEVLGLWIEETEGARMQALNRICGVYDAPELDWVLEERRKPIPLLAPGHNGHRITLSPCLLEGSQRRVLFVLSCSMPHNMALRSSSA
jgi:hypothetical protein